MQLHDATSDDNSPITRCAFDYRTGEVISPVPDSLFRHYVESLQDDPIGAVPGDDWGFPNRLIFMW